MAVQAKKSEVIDGFTIKYHANGTTRWSRGRIEDGQAVGYWEWYRPDGTLKRSGHFRAGEPIGEWVLAAQGADLTLFARNASRIDAPEGARVIEGDVLDPAALDDALDGQDIVYANLGGEVSRQAEALVTALDTAGVARLISIVSLGIYHELPARFEQWNQRMIGDALVDYRRAADVIEASRLDYTLIRPAWLTDADEIDYEITQRDEQSKGTEVSRTSVAAFVARVVADPSPYARTNVGLDKPGTDGDKPSFY